MKKIDVFDWDKTLYKKDSTIEFYKYCIKKKKSLLKYLPIQLSYFVLYKMKIVKKIKFKEKFFIFLKSINTDMLVEDFWNNNDVLIRKELINNSRNEKIVISASPEFLLKNITKKVGIDKLIASKVDKNSGKFNTDNCYGIEKVNRLKQVEDDFEIENFYTDSISDIYLAQISKRSYLIKKGGIIEWKIPKTGK